MTSTENAVTSNQKSGVRAALEYTGIPASWLSKRPKLPSRNWLIFISFTSSLAGLYIYDRQQCRKIRREYIERVKHLADEPLSTMDLARKVTVYGSKWPGDEDNEQSMKYFRKYVKPVLVAAAVDFEMINGKRHGELAARIADEIKARRRLAAGIDKPPQSPIQLPTDVSPEAKRRRELEGGIVIVGRQTFKEFMLGLKRGWTEGLERVDKQEALARELEDDGHFDEVEEDTKVEQITDGEPLPTSSRLPSSNVFSPLNLRQNPSPPKLPLPSAIPSSLNEPPSIIPQLPPLLLVSFTNLVGLKLIPLMMYDFFAQRHKVQSGAEAAYRLIMGRTRPFDRSADRDFDDPAEGYYRSSVNKTSTDIEKARSKYYEGLPTRLATARALARGVREPTKEETQYPPPTEVELRAERMKKELRWRADIEGWEVVKPESEVVWDERFGDALSVFVDPDVQAGG